MFEQHGSRAVPSCTPTSVSAIKLIQPSPDSVDGTDQANAGNILAALRAADEKSTGNLTGAQVTYTPAAASTNACTGQIDVVVPVRTVGTRTMRGQRSINVMAQTADGPVRNRLTLICEPGPF